MYMALVFSFIAALSLTVSLISTNSMSTLKRLIISQASCVSGSGECIMKRHENGFDRIIIANRHL